MTPTNRLIAFVLTVLGLGLNGCTYRVADLTMVSTKNLDLSDVKLDAKKGQRHKGEDCKIAILGIPFGLPNMETAVDQALQAGNGNVMVDEVTESKMTWFLVGSQHCIVVEGTVLNIMSQKTSPKK